MDYPDWTPNPNAKDILKSCNLSFYNYTKKSLWVGTGHTNCTDPKTLRKQIATRLIDLGIDHFRIRTFDQATHHLYPNDSSLRWTPLYLYPMTDCLTLSVPEKMKKLGIFKLIVRTHNDPPLPNLVVYVHQNGLLFTDIPNAWHDIEVSGKGLQVKVDHDVVDLLKYDFENCENDQNYKLSECQLEYLEQASDSFGSI